MKEFLFICTLLVFILVFPFWLTYLTEESCTRCSCSREVYFWNDYKQAELWTSLIFE